MDGGHPEVGFMIVYSNNNHNFLSKENFDTLSEDDKKELISLCNLDVLNYDY